MGRRSRVCGDRRTETLIGRSFLRHSGRVLRWGCPGRFSGHGDATGRGSSPDAGDGGWETGRGTDGYRIPTEAGRPTAALGVGTGHAEAPAAPRGTPRSRRGRSVGWRVRRSGGPTRFRAEVPRFRRTERAASAARGRGAVSATVRRSGAQALRRAETSTVGGSNVHTTMKIDARAGGTLSRPDPIPRRRWSGVVRRGSRATTVGTTTGGAPARTGSGVSRASAWGTWEDVEPLASRL